MMLATRLLECRRHACLYSVRGRHGRLYRIRGRASLLAALVSLSTSLTRAGPVENIEPQRGRSAAPISWTDDAGRVRKLSDFAGHPVILLPIYTRCPGACIQNVAQLKRALAESNGAPTEFRVLLFSFDPTDTTSILAKYRQGESIPLGWFLGTADQPSIDALLESIGFQTGKAGTEFMHPNMLVFLDSKLRIAKWVYGTDYSGRDIDGALKIAFGKADLVGEHREMIYALLLFAASLLCVAFFHCVRLRRIGGAPQIFRKNA